MERNHVSIQRVVKHLNDDALRNRVKTRGKEGPHSGIPLLEYQYI